MTGYVCSLRPFDFDEAGGSFGIRGMRVMAWQEKRRKGYEDCCGAGCTFEEPDF